MKALQKRDSLTGARFHEKIAPRIYEDNEVHGERIKRSRKMLADAIGESKGQRIIELGCGTLDISGPFSLAHQVSGIDCNYDAIKVAARRFPHAATYGSAGDALPRACDVLVLCEFLEHVADPVALVKAWLPLARQVVLSHPLNGDFPTDLSGGEHQWSFDASDFFSWFSLGGHEPIAHEVFKMEEYDIILGRGRAAKKSAKSEAAK